MCPEVQQKLLGSSPLQFEYSLINFKRVWNLALPAAEVQNSSDEYTPQNYRTGLCPTYFNVQKCDGCYIPGKLLCVSKKDFEVLDQFEDVDIGFMERIQLGNISLYVGTKEFQVLFENNLKKQQVFLSKAYFDQVLTANQYISTPLPDYDCLIKKSFLEFLL